MRAISLFSGAGGLDVGVERSGAIDLLACVEVNPVYCDTLRTNRDAGLLGRPETQVIQADLAELSPRSLMSALGLEPGEVDLLIGGPPCQAFSTAGRRQSVEDPRGTLLWSFLRFVEHIQPRFFLMENVRGLLSAALRHRPIKLRPDQGGPPLSQDEQPGSVVDLWMNDLRASTRGSYRVDCFEVNAVNYGAPQLRERAIFVGNRSGLLPYFPNRTHGPVDGADDRLTPFSTLGDALDGLTETDPAILDFSPRKKRYLNMVPAGGNWRALPPEIAAESMGKAFYAKGGRSGWWRRLSRDLPCPTIVTMPNHASTSMCHPDQVRALSVGECARVQEFPDGWRFAGTLQEQMTQVGNAVPVRLGEVAGRAVQAMATNPVKADEAADYRRVYLHSHVRTRRWFSEGRAVVRADPAVTARDRDAA